MDCTNAEIGKKLAAIYLMIGLRKQHLPTEIEDKLLFDYLRLHYSQKTLEEVVFAFDLAIRSELDLRDEEVKVYDQFTCEYLARIMNGYRKWLKDKSNKVEPAKQIVFGNRITSDEEKKKDIEEWMAKDISEIKIELIPPYLYDYLTSLEMLNLSIEEKYEIREQAIEMRRDILQRELDTARENGDKHSDYELKKFIGYIEAGCIEGIEVARVKDLSKKISVREFLITSKL